MTDERRREAIYRLVIAPLLAGALNAGLGALVGRPPGAMFAFGWAAGMMVGAIWLEWTR